MQSVTPLLVGVDVGTSRIKAGIYDTSGRMVSGAGAPTPTLSPAPGRTEHDAEMLWDSVVAVVRRAVGSLADPGEPAGIAGIAVASMAEAGVPLDARGAPTAPVIAWHDRRSEAQSEQLVDALGAERLRAITGLPPQPIYGICKLAWLAAHHPGAFARTRRWLNLADYVAYRLSGEMATDWSLATRTGALDLRTRGWSAAVLDAAGVAGSLLAPLAPSGTALGRLTPEAATATGLPAHTVVGVGGHDHVCGALAAGVTEPGTALDSMGTAESLLVPLTAPLPTDASSPRFSQGVHVAADRWYAAAGVHAGGASLAWVTQLLDADFEVLLAEAAGVPAGAHGVTFAPHLPLPGVVEGAPGALLGLTPQTDRATLLRAVLEGVAVAAGDVLARVLTQAGISDPPQLRVVGGGSRDALHLAIKAAVTGWSLHRPAITEAGALGAALLGGISAGQFPDTTAAVAAVDRAGEQVDPDPALAPRYVPVVRRIRALHDLAGGR